MQKLPSLNLYETIGPEGNLLRGILSIPANTIKSGLICIHGFERCSTTEKKFKEITTLASLSNISSLRLDFSGCGLSDGNFGSFTVAKRKDEFLHVFHDYQKKIGLEKITCVAHSLGGCVLALALSEITDKIDKIILFGPALNQAKLLRFWFVLEDMKKNIPNQKIEWDNFNQFLDEDKFILYCKLKVRETKENYMDADYFLENKDMDYSAYFKEVMKKTLLIHGDKDPKVPLQSLNIEFPHKHIVINGDHDLEKPNYLDQWSYTVLQFLS